MSSLRLAVLSDLHLESGAWVPGPVAADLVVVAGDVAPGVAGVVWAAEAFAGLPVVYVPGNREHWGHAGAPRVALAAAAAATPNVHLLQDGVAEIDLGGRRLAVLGSTLWTDFALEGTAEAVMAQAGASMPDYRNASGDDGGPLTPAQVLAWNRASRAFLERAAAVERRHPLVVVTHHAPSPRSLPRRRPGHVGEITSVSLMDEVVAASRAALWVHGHTHADADYRLEGTRVLARQRGGAGRGAFAPLVLAL